MTETQTDRLLKLAKSKNIDLTKCPTCLRQKKELPEGDQVWYDDDTCDCEQQDRLRRHYLLAEIPSDYWRISFRDFYGDPRALDAAWDYLERWDIHRLQGIGARFYAPTLGVGKTTLACLIGKALVKLKEDVYFTSFYDIIGLYEMPYDEREAKVTLLRNVPVLILDEVGVGFTDNQRDYFAMELESLIRFRTSGNSITIMTTNMTNERLEEVYPRCFSLLSQKQIAIEVGGMDTRLAGKRDTSRVAPIV